MREQVKAEMEKEKSPVKYNIHSTGNKKNINGFNCEEYRVEGEEKIILIWASTDNSGIVKEVVRITKKFAEVMKMGEEDEEVDEWTYVPGKIPIQVQTLNAGMMGEPVLRIQVITKIEKRKPPIEKFNVPGKSEGFTEVSIMDMMNGIPNME